jgi:hypothetical protein
MVGFEIWNDEKYSSSTVEPYNLVLAAQTLISGYFDMHVVMSNQSIVEVL